jgi:hypothetical protein
VECSIIIYQFPKRLINPAFHSNLYTVEKSAPFSVSTTRYSAEMLRRILPVYKFWRFWTFLFTYSMIAQTFTALELIKTHRGTSNNLKFDMKTMEFLKIDK